MYSFMAMIVLLNEVVIDVKGQVGQENPLCERL